MTEGSPVFCGNTQVGPVWSLKIVCPKFDDDRSPLFRARPNSPQSLSQVLRKTRGAIDVSHTCLAKESSKAYPGHWSWSHFDGIIRNSRINFGQGKYESSAWMCMSRGIPGVLKLIAAAPRSQFQSNCFSKWPKSLVLLGLEFWCIPTFGESNQQATRSSLPDSLAPEWAEPNSCEVRVTTTSSSLHTVVCNMGGCQNPWVSKLKLSVLCWVGYWILRNLKSSPPSSSIDIAGTGQSAQNTKDYARNDKDRNRCQFQVHTGLHIVFRFMSCPGLSKSTWSSQIVHTIEIHSFRLIHHSWINRCLPTSYTLPISAYQVYPLVQIKVKCLPCTYSHSKCWTC